MPPRKLRSEACANCRSRRIKVDPCSRRFSTFFVLWISNTGEQCNQLKPRCSQCARAGLTCSGFRTPYDLVFRDETSLTIRKHYGIKYVNEQNIQSHVTNAGPIAGLALPVEDVAEAFFFRNYSIVGSCPNCGKSTIQQLQCSLPVCVISVGLAGLATAKNDYSLMNRAKQKYGNALYLLTKELLDYEESTVGTTVAASFVLSMFEIVACDNISNAYLWLKHLHGTTALLQSWYTSEKKIMDQLDGVSDVCYVIILASLLGEMPVPQFLVDLMQHVMRNESFTKTSPATQLFTIIVDTVNTYLMTKNHQNADLVSQVTMATYLDKRIQDWAAGLFPSWGYHTVTGVFPDQFHIYRDSWYAKMWNYYRLCRLLANIAILKSVDQISSAVDGMNSRLVTELDIQRDKSASRLLQISYEIYASIPYFLGAYNEKGFAMKIPSEVLFLVRLLQTVWKVNSEVSNMDSWLCHTLQLFEHYLGPTNNIFRMKYLKGAIIGPSCATAEDDT
ncbi:hypothetical protein F5884DRAFT_854432 [Xylogone sp. PMI_703]|nr:hypothetical protein F5884DRAFT_854432 [Xylogone sp. PMI_703]